MLCTNNIFWHFHLVSSVLLSVKTQVPHSLRKKEKDVVMYRYSGISLCHKENKIVLFAATRLQLQVIILNEVSKKKTNTIWYHLYVESKIWHKWSYLWNRSKITERPGLQQWEKGDGMGVSGLAEMETRTFRMDKQQGPTISYEELHTISWGKP